MTWQYILTFLLSIGVAICATLHIRIDRMNLPERIHAFRPLALFLLATIALLAPQPVSIFYKGSIMLALYFSAAIGLLIMIPGTPLIVSLASALVVYFLYLLAFASENALRLPTPLILLLVVIGFALYRSISPRLRELKWSLLAYLVVAGLMGWQALELTWQNPTTWTLMAAMGAMFLLAADAALALDRFRIPLGQRKMFILAAYYAAHWLIAVSVWGAQVWPFRG